MIGKLKNYLVSLRDILHHHTAILDNISSVNLASLDRLSRSQAVTEARLERLHDLAGLMEEQLRVNADLIRANTDLVRASLDEAYRRANMLGEIGRSLETLKKINGHADTGIEDALINLMIANNREVYAALAAELQVKTPQGRSLVRFGARKDGGYVMDDALDGMSVAVSLGVGNDVSWDLAMAERGMQVLQFDPTVDELVEEHPNFVWKKIGICGGDKYILYPRGGEYEYKTLGEALAEFSPQYPAILKMDIEGFEYEVFLEAGELLENFDQILVEFHDLQYPDRAKLCARILSRLSRSFQLAHIHPNNYGKRFMVDGTTFASVLELTLLKKDGRAFAAPPDDATGLDFPNDESVPEIIMWNN